MCATVLCRDLGFSDADRRESIRRVAKIGQPDGGRRPDCLTAFISPRTARRAYSTGKERHFGRLSGTPYYALAICERRDPKGCVKHLGELRNFTGIDAIYRRLTHTGSCNGEQW